MAVNHHLDYESKKPDQDLLQDLIDEAIQIKGLDVYYVPKTLVDANRDLFGEDAVKKYESAYPVEVYVDSADGFEGEVTASMFGLDVQHGVLVTISRTSFEKHVGDATGIKRPTEGDLIWFPMVQGLFEIIYVAHEKIFYQLGKLRTYQLRLQLFTYSHEEINTGIDDIDGIEDAFENSGTNLDNIPGSSNDNIETEADSVLDFDESNPFGSF